MDKKVVVSAREEYAYIWYKMEVSKRHARE